MTGFAAVGVVSRDVPATVAFYGALGVQLVRTVGKHYEGKMSPGVRLMVDEESMMKKLIPKWARGSGSSGVVMCFEQEDAAGVDATVARCLAAGGTQLVAPWDAFWGQRYASVLDPDRNQVDIFAPLGGGESAEKSTRPAKRVKAGGE